MLVKQAGHGPLCPLSTEPAHPAHRTRVRIFNAFYGATDREPSGDMTPAAEKAYYGANAAVGEFMLLYTETAEGLLHGALVSVQAWWFRCPTCGFVLPAQPKENY